MLSLSNSTVSDWSEITKLEKSDPLPVFTSGKAEFVVVKGTPSALALAPIQAAHDLFNAQGDQLKADFEARERAISPAS